MIVEMIIKTDDRKLISHFEWKGNLQTHQGEVEMIIGVDMRRAVQQHAQRAADNGVPIHLHADSKDFETCPRCSTSR